MSVHPPVLADNYTGRGNGKIVAYNNFLKLTVALRGNPKLFNEMKKCFVIFAIFCLCTLLGAFCVKTVKATTILNNPNVDTSTNGDYGFAFIATSTVEITNLKLMVVCSIISASNYQTVCNLQVPSQVFATSTTLTQNCSIATTTIDFNISQYNLTLDPGEILVYSCNNVSSSYLKSAYKINPPLTNEGLKVYTPTYLYSSMMDGAGIVEGIFLENNNECPDCNNNCSPSGSSTTTPIIDCNDLDTINNLNIDELAECNATTSSGIEYTKTKIPFLLIFIIGGIILLIFSRILIEFIIRIRQWTSK